MLRFSQMLPVSEKKKEKKAFSNLIHHKVSAHDIILCLYGITGKFQRWYLSEAYAN